MEFFFDVIEFALIVIPIFYPLRLRAHLSEQVDPTSRAMPGATILIAVSP